MLPHHIYISSHYFWLIPKSKYRNIITYETLSLLVVLQLEEKSEFRKKMNSDSLCHPPEFVVRPRGQTVWEGKTLKLHCTVAGWPKPRMAWWGTTLSTQSPSHAHNATSNLHHMYIQSVSRRCYTKRLEGQYQSGYHIDAP